MEKISVRCCVDLGFNDLSGLNAFTLSPTRWIEATNAIGLFYNCDRNCSLSRRHRGAVPAPVVHPPQAITISRIHGIREHTIVFGRNIG